MCLTRRILPIPGWAASIVAYGARKDGSGSLPLVEEGVVGKHLIATVLILVTGYGRYSTP